jgi:hypothetical protein
MGSTLSFEYKEAIPHLQLIPDTISGKNTIINNCHCKDCLTANREKEPSCKLDT